MQIEPDDSNNLVSNNFAVAVGPIPIALLPWRPLSATCTRPIKASPALRKEIANLRYRVRLIRDMQAIGGISLLLCVVCILLLFLGLETLGRTVFALSLILMMVSLALSFREIQVSTRALNYTCAI